MTTPEGQAEQRTRDGADPSASTAETRPASVSLLLGGTTVPVWFGLAVEEMCRRTGVTVGDVTVATGASNRGGFRNVTQSLLIAAQDAVIMSDLDREIDVHLLPSVSAACIHRITPKYDGGPGVRLPDSAIERITSDTDVVVHHGVGILRGGILQRPEFGVLGFHHGDIREYRGPGYGFWEYMHDERRSGVTLQVLRPGLDEGAVVEIAPVDISDARTLAEVRRRLNAASVPLLARGIERLRDSTFEPSRLPDSELGKMYYYADATVTVKARYALKEAVTRLRRRLRRL